ELGRGPPRGCRECPRSPLGYGEGLRSPGLDPGSRKLWVFDRNLVKVSSGTESEGTCIVPNIRPPRHERTPADRSRAGTVGPNPSPRPTGQTVVGDRENNTGAFRGPKEAAVSLLTSGGKTRSP